MAVKIVRQLKSVALLGAPTSAASLTPGHERGPAALRAAGLVGKLTEAGFSVTDYGDCATRISQPDDEHPRARGASQVLATLEELRPKVEIAVKTGALPVILGGDDSIVLAAIAGARRYFRDVSLIYVDRDAGLNEPATTPSGCVDGMVISHVVGRGAPELVRFWGEPPLVRETDVVLFGVARLDESEQKFLGRSLMRRYMADEISRLGAAAAAKQAFDQAHGHRSEFVLHVDLDVIASEDFAATNLAAPGGLRLDELRDALAFLVSQNRLAALSIGGYNPALDADGSAAKRVVALIVDILKPRLEPPPSAEVPEAVSAEKTGTAEKTEAPVSEAARTSPAAVATETSRETAMGLSDGPNEPSNDPSREPSNDPAVEPSNDPSHEPSNEPSNEPAGDLSREPSNEPPNTL